MGDIFFIVRMMIYTTLIVLVMQIKVGTSTLEEKVTDWTHRSEFSLVIKGLAQGAVTAIGVGYNRAVQNIDTPFSKSHQGDQIPGKRLRKEIDATKNFIKRQFKSSQDEVEEISEDNSHN